MGIVRNRFLHPILLATALFTHRHCLYGWKLALCSHAAHAKARNHQCCVHRPGVHQVPALRRCLVCPSDKIIQNRHKRTPETRFTMRAAFTPSSVLSARQIAMRRVARACPRKLLSHRMAARKLLLVADMRGRDAEFSVSGPPAPLGIDWNHWCTHGEKGEVPISTSQAPLSVASGRYVVLCSRPVRTW
jgi:hypothetical protein